ncbi:MAG: malto-oligosyltrehalose trehalohydrolase, partial [Bacteroidales bacterium]
AKQASNVHLVGEIMPSTAVKEQRRLAVGAEVHAGGVHFRCWAPRHARVAVVIEGPGPVRVEELKAEQNGYFSALVRGVAPGALYRYRLGDSDANLFPDPASRFQPQGPHGPSEVIDPATYAWHDAEWKGPRLAAQVIYELHVGTFTREGTWAAAAGRLPALADLGVTLLEVMPVAEFPGEFGWGYDGVDLYAPTRLYGRPDDFRRFVDEAHRLGLGVLLDVVYNHVGPDGSFLSQFSDDYFSARYENEWGEALNFDGAGCESVREFFVSNAGYWVDEFHLDGLRLDATQAIHDASPVNVIADITSCVRQKAGKRAAIVVGENEPQHVWLLRPAADRGGGMDALWNDDFHHAAVVALTGRKEAYYTDYDGTPQELVSASKRGFLYQGQMYSWQKKRRGTPTRGVSPAALVTYLENHDQVANSGRGERLHRLTSPGRLRAMTALMLLLPATPMLFMGQEFAASAPFLYFADHVQPLAEQVRKGRGEFLAQFPSLATEEMFACLANPGSRDTFERCKLDWRERDEHHEALALHRDLLALRRTDSVFASQAGAIDGAVLAAEAFVLRFFAPGNRATDRLLLVNLGRDLRLAVAPEPLLAPPEGMHWELRWSSEAPAYGGCGTASPETDAGWRMPGHAALVLVARD